MRAALALLLIAAPATAQFQLFIADTLSERPAAAVQDLGSVARGDTLSTRFRLRNITASPAAVRTLEVAGTGFSLADPVALPQTVNTGAALEFTVNFRANSEGLFSAALRSEGVSVLLTASVVAQLTLAQQGSLGAQPLAAGALISFGTVERGASTAVRLLFQNQTPTDQITPPLQIIGASFALPAPSPSGRVLHPLEELGFDVTFTPTAAGVFTAILLEGNRSFTLQGTAIEPALPRASPSITIAKPQSGEQGVAAVLLAEKSRTSGRGTLTLAFAPILPGAVDPAIQFASGGRSANFSVTEGDDRGYFADLPVLPFQTGTTAGTLTFTAQLGGVSQQQTIVVPPAPVTLASVEASRTAGAVEVRIGGFDNARTAGPLSFTFFDRTGAAIGPGAIRVDSSADFGRYFQSSTAGGLFLLSAIFPVTGDSIIIDSVEVELTNSVGATKSARTRVN